MTPFSCTCLKGFPDGPDATFPHFGPAHGRPEEAMMFDFGTWKSRDYPCVLSGGKVAETQEALEETMMNLNTMNAGELSTRYGLVHLMCSS